MSDKFIDYINLDALVVGQWYTCRQSLAGTSNYLYRFGSTDNNRCFLEKETPFLLLKSETNTEGEVWLTILAADFGRFYFFFTDKEFLNAFRSLTTRPT